MRDCHRAEPVSLRTGAELAWPAEEEASPAGKRQQGTWGRGGVRAGFSSGVQVAEGQRDGSWCCKQKQTKMLAAYTSESIRRV